MSANKRGSVNTSLKNARIFDDSDESFDSNDVFIKKEPGTSLEIKTPIKQEPREFSNDPEDSNSPFNKKLFENFHIKQEDSPLKTIKEEKCEDIEETSKGPVHSRLGPKQSRKSAKRSVFTRDSPYKRDDEQKTQSRHFKRALTEPGRNEQKAPKKKHSKPIELESDPVVLARRQKQIDFGKNTLGYDNFKRLVPVNERASDDPQTPNKLIKYSRRAWDGLIKQWRLRIHKYDPAESE